MPKPTKTPGTRPTRRTKPAKIKSYLVHLSTWRWEGIVLLGGTAEDCQELLLKKYHMHVKAEEEARGYAFFNPAAPWAIWVPNPQDFTAMAHEALHITQWILRHRGVRFHAASDETFCYTQEDILSQVFEQL